jgi:hypothetical protein
MMRRREVLALKHNCHESHYTDSQEEGEELFEGLYRTLLFHKVRKEVREGNVDEAARGERKDPPRVVTCKH